MEQAPSSLGVAPLVESEPAVLGSSAAQAEPASAKDRNTPENGTEKPEETMANESLGVSAVDVLAVPVAPTDLPLSPPILAAAEAVKPLALVTPDPMGGAPGHPSVAKPESRSTEWGQQSPYSPDKLSLPSDPKNPISGPLAPPMEHGADAPIPPKQVPMPRQLMRAFDQPKRSFWEKLKQFLRL